MMDNRQEKQDRTQYDFAFWSMLDELVRDSEIVIDRPKGSRHPKYPEMVYEVDYGYLKNTSSMDGGGIDVWRGTAQPQKVDAVICIVDRAKRDSELKILIGCTEAEKDTIYRFHNRTEGMKGIFLTRKSG